MADKMKKVLIVMEGVSLGGTSSSLFNLLYAMKAYPEIDITVGLINIEQKTEIPEGIKILDFSCLSRKIPGKINHFFYILRVGFFTWVRLKLNKTFSNKSSRNTKLVSCVQKFEMKSAKAVKTYIDLRTKYDVVISWCEMFTNYLLAYKIKADKKIAWIHPHYEQAGFEKSIDEEMIKRVDAVVAVSKEGVNSLVRVFPEFADKFYCVYNKYIVPDIIRKSKFQKPKYSDQVCNMITVARIQNVSKALDRLINIMSKLHTEGFEFKWRIIGGGEDFEQVRQLVSEYHLEEVVELLGPKNNPFPYVAASDLFLLCSKYEGFPMVVDEAMILGIPTMVTDYAAASEQIENEKDGIIVSNSFEGIYEELKKVLTDSRKLVVIRKNLKNRTIDRYMDCDDFVSLINQI